MSEVALNATAGDYASAMEEAGRRFDLDPSLEAEVQTDKRRIKIVPCLGCKRPLVVNTFYSPKIARCEHCRDDSGGTVEAPQAGRTDPAKVRDLNSVLINLPFAKALCPVHPDNEEHRMELKWVSHSEHHGPSETIGYDAKGIPQVRQMAPGETVMHQCLACKATVVYSTTAPVQFRRQNEIRGDRRVSDSWLSVLGERTDQ